MKVFISQPMRDKTDEEIKNARAFAQECVKSYYPGEDIEIIDNFFEGAPHDAKPLLFLGESFKRLADADLVYFIRGWDEYRGCKMENQAAKQYGLNVVEENYDDSGNVVLSRYEGTTKVSAAFPKQCIIRAVFTGKSGTEYYTDLISSRLRKEYPEITVSAVKGYKHKDGDEEYYEIIANGTVKNNAVTDDIKLTHHAEALYDDTDMEYTHVEVFIDGKWYGREENKNA